MLSNSTKMFGLYKSHVKSFCFCSNEALKQQNQFAELKTTMMKYGTRNYNIADFSKGMVSISFFHASFFTLIEIFKKLWILLLSDFFEQNINGMGSQYAWFINPLKKYKHDDYWVLTPDFHQDSMSERERNWNLAIVTQT